MSVTELIRLRYPAICAVCGADLPPRSRARWDRETKQATCATCAGGKGTQAETLDRGTAGASAARRYERLHERREKRAREQYGRLAGVYLALSDDPQSTKAWAKGSRGEHALGGYLEKLDDGASIIVLHDRRIPGTRANVDHIAVTSNGVHVIDAKNYTGKVQRVDRGGWFSTDWRLYVGRRDCTKLVTGMGKQIEAVRAGIGPALLEELDLATKPVLCFVLAEWSLFARPFELGGVWVGWANALGDRLRAPGPLQPEQVRMVADRLGAAALPPA